ncbi:transcriptional regulator [Micromonospora echinospora]|uniref:Transcriptional regulator, ArsR family n=1 Tax=Micromonospora echinospora TaxID=1877 RepID=A0A1C4Z7N4_MICEC|nr:metalloregulator ArsR/SmtB family transcription factor [Micromonospora echinospora]OZV78179.1 transcriptional regulator [Micromonospora echinospora]SCF29002.1 transcriptional regulator, ArsR family [Micromonospora echinospora]
MDEVVEAIADPIRRNILEMLRDGRLTAGDIAAHFPVSRPAVSRHLRVLRQAGLVRDELVGRQRLYQLESEPFTALVEWLARFDQPRGWEHRLDALETEVYRTRRERRGSTGRPAEKKRTA